MIVRHFLDWVRTAPAGKRAEATAALARAYLILTFRLTTPQRPKALC
jgi:uncharacterized protein (DUF2336 family)